MARTSAVHTGKSGTKFRLSSLKMEGHIRTADYLSQLEKLQRRLQVIQQAYLHTRNRAVVVFEGWDAAGKGGTIRRMSAVLDPRGFKVWPIGAPRGPEEEQHYLTRFWERLPPHGTVAVFDRSWYGRVLVERVEGFAASKEWRRAYAEINDFESLLVKDGTRMVKLFLHITPDEQKRRFEARLRDPLKRWKLSYEDFRNRARWADYERAVEEMVAKTSPKSAPWYVVPANNKKRTRLLCLSLIAERLAQGVDLSPPGLDENMLMHAVELLGPDIVAGVEKR